MLKHVIRLDVAFCCNRRNGLTRFQSSWDSGKIRQTFIDYFANEHGYSVVPSAPVVPFNDPSLFFTNAGMNQFKPIFLGSVRPNSKQAQLRTVVNSQKCVRATGKHNDFSEVGHDTFHHTFFEMLGNWSFNGSLSKKTACGQALRLLCEVYGIPKDRLFITYFGGCEQLGLPADTETLDIWKQLGVQTSQLAARSADENFWEVEDVGPCGPCTELHYSFGATPNWEETVELWNIVFIDYQRDAEDKTLKKLSSTHIDTGMGLERLAAILQRKTSNYETDLFAPIIREIEKQPSAVPYRELYGVNDKQGTMAAYRIIADHSRMFTVALADGVVPDVRNAGHVLRKVIRHASYQSQLLGAKHGFLSSLVSTVANSLGAAYPEIVRNLDFIKQSVDQEEAKFRSVLAKAKSRFHEMVEEASEKRSPLQTYDLFSLYISFGLPKEIIFLMAENAGIQFNKHEFANEEERHRQVSGRHDADQTSLIVGNNNISEIVKQLRQLNIPPTKDKVKYAVERDEATGTYAFPNCIGNVLAILHEGRLVNSVPHFDDCLLVLNATPFYAEAGGQVSDIGMLCGQETAIFDVTHVFADSGYVFHKGTLKTGGIEIGDDVSLLVDKTRRLGCMQHHTATHLLLAALENSLNTVLKQRASIVRANMARLGVWCSTNITPELLCTVEDKVNDYVEASLVVHAEELPLDEAYAMSKERSVRWMHGELYPDPVRIVWILDQHIASTRESVAASIEPCCGTHVADTSDLKLFRILSLDNLGTNLKAITFAAGDAASAADELALSFERLTDLSWERICKGEESEDTLKAIRQDLSRSFVPLRRKLALNKKLLQLSKSRKMSDVKRAAVELKE